MIHKTLTPYIKTILEKKAVGNTNPIFVFIGIEEYVNMDVFEKYVVDKK